MSAPPPPPESHRTTFDGTPARAHRGPFGVRRWVWLLAWRPIVPVAMFALWMPSFASPVASIWPVTAAILAVLLGANLAAGRGQSSEAAIAAVSLTTCLAFLYAFFGPAIALVVGGLLGTHR
jgi:hypothetical protein